MGRRSLHPPYQAACETVQNLSLIYGPNHFLPPDANVAKYKATLLTELWWVFLTMCYYLYKKCVVRKDLRDPSTPKPS